MTACSAFGCGLKISAIALPFALFVSLWFRLQGGTRQAGSTTRCDGGIWRRAQAGDHCSPGRSGVWIVISCRRRKPWHRATAGVVALQRRPGDDHGRSRSRPLWLTVVPTDCHGCEGYELAPRVRWTEATSFRPGQGPFRACRSGSPVAAMPRDGTATRVKVLLRVTRARDLAGWLQRHAGGGDCFALRLVQNRFTIADVV